MSGAVVQQVAQTINGTGVTPDILTFTSVTTSSGNALVIVFESYYPSGVSGGTPVQTVSDGVNTWARVGNPIGDGARAYMEVWHTTNVAPALSSATITVSWTTNINMVVSAHLFELSGVNALGGPVDKAALSIVHTAGGPSWTVTGGTPTGINQFYLVAIGQSNYASLFANPTISSETMTAGAPSSSYPSSTTFTIAGPAQHACLHTAALQVSGNAAQTYSGTASAIDAEGYFAAVIPMLNTYTGGDFFMVL